MKGLGVPLLINKEETQQYGLIQPALNKSRKAHFGPTHKKDLTGEKTRMVTSEAS